MVFSFFACTLAWSQTDSTRHAMDSLRRVSKAQARLYRQQLRKDLRLTREQFLEKYGIDDTARAMVHLFARKKTAGIVKLAVSPVLSGAATLFLVVAVFGGGPEFIVATFLTAALYDYAFYGGIVQLIKYPRIRLIEAIQDHKAGLPYPKKYTKHLSLTDFQKSARK